MTAVGRGFFPLDEQLQSVDGWSEGLLEHVLWATQAMASYREAEEAFERFWGWSIPKSTLHRLAQRYGGALAEQQEAEGCELWEGKALILPRKAPCERFGVALDGMMVWVDDGWHEVKVGSCFTYGPDRHGEIQTQAIGYLAWYGEEVETFRRTLWGYAYHQGLGMEGKAIVLGDGAVWIDTFAHTYCPQGKRIVDWYHAVEHLAALGREAYGEQAGGWLAQVTEWLWQGEIADVIQECRAVLQSRTAWSPEVARTAEYFQERQEQMEYDQYRAAGYPIGSGIVESACKGIAWRCRNRGQRWKKTGLRAILALRAAGMSGKTAWKETWANFRSTA